MRGIERKLSIMKQIQAEGQASITELSDQYHVSSMTIRRDLLKLAEDGVTKQNLIKCRTTPYSHAEFSLQQFSRYLQSEKLQIQSYAEIDRALIEEYLIHKATDGSPGHSNSDDILKLRSVLESIGKIDGYPHLEKLFINTDIPQEVQPEFTTYSDEELKRLNAHITKLDEQITRCLVIHQYRL